VQGSAGLDRIGSRAPLGSVQGTLSGTPVRELAWNGNFVTGAHDAVGPSASLVPGQLRTHAG
jgi:hypothetical protein